jgi:hypothetical protein
LPQQESDLKKLVLIDNAIPQFEQVPPVAENLYGWVCESRSVVSELHSFITWNYSKLAQRFKAIYVSDKNLVSLSPVFKYCPAGSNLPWICETDYKMYPKTKLTSMIASPKQFTKGHKIRHGYAERFKDKLDLFGGACGSPRLGSKTSSMVSSFSAPWSSKGDGIKDYMFHIVVENDFYDNYYTEKLTDCFATGTVPVYLGSPAVGDQFNMDGIILLDEKFDINSLNEDLYNSKLDAIKDNLERVRQLKMADDVLWELIEKN